MLEPILVVGLGCSLGVRDFDPWPTRYLYQHQEMAVDENRSGIPCWLVGEFTTHVGTYFSGWIGMFTGGTGF